MASNEEPQITKLEYGVFPSMNAPRHGDANLQMKGHVTMADYHFRVNVERLGVDPLTVKTRTEWGEGACRFEIEAPAPEETLSIAWDEAVRLIGLRAEPFSKSAR